MSKAILDNNNTNKKIKELLNKQKKDYNLTLIDNYNLFDLFDFLFEDKTYLQLLKFVYKDYSIDLEMKEEIKNTLINIFEKDILSKLAYLQITFLYLRRKCIIDAENMSDKLKESLILIKYQTKG